MGGHEEDSSLEVWHVLGGGGQAVDAWTEVAAVGACDIARQPIPVADLAARERVRLVVAHATRERLAVEVFELGGEVADNVRFTRRGQCRERQVGADVSVPVTHRRSPTPR